MRREVREYSPLVVAEVAVTGVRKDAAGKGFRLLAGYIFGGTTRRQKIVMTAPVIQSPAGETIAMTAVLQAWYPGQRGGEAIARVLAGDVAPSGKLPMTFPAGVEQLPRPHLAGAALPSTGLFGVTQPFAVTYGEGADVGYRWFERSRQVPLFPFGYGLSDGRFDLKRNGVRGSSIGITVRNTGRRAGSEVAQLYVRPPRPGATFRLAGWARVVLRPSEVTRVNLAADRKALAEYEAGGWHLAGGRYDYYVGTFASDRRITGMMTIVRGKL